jgi:hypothetical protein
MFSIIIMNPELAEIINKTIKLYKKYKTPFNVVGFFILVMLFFQGMIHALVIDAFVFSFLSYKTLLVLKYKSDDNVYLLHILKLWACYSSYIIIEKVVDVLMYFTPFSIAYYTSKFGFYLWILKDKDNVDSYYNTIVNPMFNKYETQITIFMGGLEKYTRLLLSIVIEYVYGLKNNVIKFITDKINDGTFKQLEEKLNKLQYEDLEKDVNDIKDNEPSIEIEENDGPDESDTNMIEDKKLE